MSGFWPGRNPEDFKDESLHLQAACSDAVRAFFEQQIEEERAKDEPRDDVIDALVAEMRRQTKR